MWEAIRQSAEIDWLRHDAERRLSQLTALDQMDALQKLVDRRTPLPGIPVDPAGTPYEIDASGRVRLSTRSPLFPIPEEPQRLSTPPRP